MKPLMSFLVILALVGYAQTSLLLGQDVGTALKENLDLPFNAIGDTEEVEEDAPEVIFFYGQTYEANGIFFVIDRSSSMQRRGELAVAKREVIRNISDFSEGVEFGIVFFDSNVLKWPQSGTPADYSKKQAGISWVAGMAGGSGSNILDGVVAGLQFANRSSVERNTVIYVGDGRGSTPSHLGIIRSRNLRDATINTIGVVDVSASRREFLKQLAQGNKGRYTEIMRCAHTVR